MNILVWLRGNESTFRISDNMYTVQLLYPPGVIQHEIFVIAELQTPDSAFSLTNHLPIPLKNQTLILVLFWGQ